MGDQIAEPQAKSDPAPCFPAGHFYSPIPLITPAILEDYFQRPLSPNLPNINLGVEQQLQLLKIFQSFYATQPFSAHKKAHLRYYFENDFYAYCDAIFLHCLLRKIQPKRVIEVGSGYTSAVMLDTNELFLNNQTQFTFIDPHPERLHSLLKEKTNATILDTPLQNVDMDIFTQLSAGDILFIDSTHVAKFNSDVNLLFFNVLPLLKRGVYIHFHDIFYPFEYPAEWLLEGRAWNEAYILRAFLQHNNCFQIVLFSDYLARFHRDALAAMPLCLKNTGGNIWLQKQAE